MFGLGGQELLIIFILVLLLFGGAQIPKLMRGLGQGLGEFNKGVEEGKKNLKKSIDDAAREQDAKEAAATKSDANG